MAQGHVHGRVEKRKGSIYLVIGIFQPLLQVFLSAAELLNCQEETLKCFGQRLDVRVLGGFRDNRSRSHVGSS